MLTLDNNHEDDEKMPGAPDLLLSFVPQKPEDEYLYERLFDIARSVDGTVCGIGDDGGVVVVEDENDDDEENKYDPNSMRSDAAVSFFTQRHSPELEPETQLEVILAVTEIHRSRKRVSKSQFYVAVRMIQFHQNLEPIVHLDLRRLPDDKGDKKLRPPTFRNVRYDDFNVVVVANNNDNDKSATATNEQQQQQQQQRTTTQPTKNEGDHHQQQHHNNNNNNNDHGSSSSFDTERNVYVSSLQPQRTDANTVSEGRQQQDSSDDSNNKNDDPSSRVVIPFRDDVTFDAMTSLDRHRYELAYANEYDVAECGREQKNDSSSYEHVLEELSLALGEGIVADTNELDRAYRLVKNDSVDVRLPNNKNENGSPPERLSRSEFCAAMHMLVCVHERGRHDGVLPPLSSLPASLRTFMNDLEGTRPKGNDFIVGTTTTTTTPSRVSLRSSDETNSRPRPPLPDTQYSIGNVDGPFTIVFRPRVVQTTPKRDDDRGPTTTTNGPIVRKTANASDNSSIPTLSTTNNHHHHHHAGGAHVHHPRVDDRRRSDEDYSKLENQVQELASALSTALDHVNTLAKELSLIRAGMAAYDGHERHEIFRRQSSDGRRRRSRRRRFRDWSSRVDSDLDDDDDDDDLFSDRSEEESDDGSISSDEDLYREDDEDRLFARPRVPKKLPSSILLKPNNGMSESVSSRPRKARSYSPTPIPTTKEFLVGSEKIPKEKNHRSLFSRTPDKSHRSLCSRTQDKSHRSLFSRLEKSRRSLFATTAPAPEKSQKPLSLFSFVGDVLQSFAFRQPEQQQHQDGGSGSGDGTTTVVVDDGNKSIERTSVSFEHDNNNNNNNNNKSNSNGEQWQSRSLSPLRRHSVKSAPNLNQSERSSARSDAFYIQMMNSSRSLYDIKQTNQRLNKMGERRGSTQFSARRQFQKRSPSISSGPWWSLFRRRE